jgi:hypothetical protein
MVISRRILRRIHIIGTPIYNAQDGVIAFESDNNHVFFGYYDVTPFNHDESRLLALQIPINQRKLVRAETASVGYYQIQGPTQDFFKIDETQTWCWQQGCRLRWYPGPRSDLISYNTLVGGRYGSVIYDLNAIKKIAEIRTPLYDIASDGKWGLSLNFSRLQRLRPGYGYHVIPDSTIEEAAPDNDGLVLCDIQSGRTAQLFSIKEISEFDPNPTMIGAAHYFNHVSINSIGSRILFFHIWVNAGKRYTRLLTCNKDGTDLFPLIQDRIVSHFTWKTDNEILCFTIKNQSELNYILYRDKSDVNTIPCPKLQEDGHPSYSPSKSYVLTDTYPDQFGDRNLLLYNLETEKMQCIGSFYSPLSLVGENRCDLHPRWSPSGKSIVIDSAHRGKRGMYVVPFPDTRLC